MDRLLIDGITQAKELPVAIDLVIHTKVPSKYLLIDQETGQVYEGVEKGLNNPMHWSHVGTVDKIPEYEKS